VQSTYAGTLPTVLQTAAAVLIGFAVTVGPDTKTVAVQELVRLEVHA
jgi:hypothetical protein